MNFVVFDWSGTISDEKKIGYRVMCLALKHFNKPQMDYDTWLSEYTLPYMNFVNKFLHISKDEWDSFILENFHTGGFPKLLPHVEKTLKYLHDKGYKMAIVSSHPQKLVDAEVLHYFGGSHYFEKVFAGVYDKIEDMPKILNELNFDPKQSVYVGDTPFDIRAGKNAGMKTVALCSGFTKKEILEKENADYLFEDIAGMKGIL